MKKISTTIGEEAVKEVKRNNWKWNDLIYMGIAAKKQNSPYVERIKEMDRKLESTAKTLQQYIGLYWKSQEEIEKLQKK
jgi:hypothetical protein